MSPRILVLAGSIRTGSFNAKLAAAVAKEVLRIGAEVSLISLIDTSIKRRGRRNRPCGLSV